MTDAPAPTPTDEGKSTFVIVPNLELFLELDGRVSYLEANTPAHDDTPTDGGEADLAQLHDRLDRHRSEIEEIKNRYNALIRYLGSTDLASAAPAAAQDTVQPQSRNMIP